MFKRNLLKSLRKKSGLSLDGLAVDITVKTKSKITRATLQNIESGRYNPSLDTLFILAGYFDVSPLSFFSQKRSKTSYAS